MTNLFPFLFFYYIFPTLADVYYSKQRADKTDFNVQCLIKADKVSTSVNTTTYEKV